MCSSVAKSAVGPHAGDCDWLVRLAVKSIGYTTPRTADRPFTVYPHLMVTTDTSSRACNFSMRRSPPAHAPLCAAEVRAAQRDGSQGQWTRSSQRLADGLESRGEVVGGCGS